MGQGLVPLEHRRKRTWSLVLAWAGFWVSFLLMFAAVAIDQPWLLLVCVAGMIILPIVGGVMARVVRPVRITDTEVWLKAGEPFVASLPSQPQLGVGGYGVPYGAMGYGAPPAAGRAL